MKIKLLSVFVAALSLAACANNSASTSNNPQHVHQHAGHHHSHHGHSHAGADKHQAPTALTFECKNGMTVKAEYATDSVTLAVDTMEARSTLTHTRAASGELYTNDKGFYGNHTVWHQKINEAYFEFRDAYGNVVKTSCYTK